MLLLGSVAIALLLARQSAASTLVTVIIGVPSLFFTYAAYRDDRRAEQVSADEDAADEGIPKLADRLAPAVRAQWRAEAVARGLSSSPYPLSVSWEPADPSLVDRWSNLITLAGSGGWPQAELAWASGPGELAGRGSGLADVLARVPTGRLVVLGEPGSGKTVLVLRLVLDLLEHFGPNPHAPEFGDYGVCQVRFGKAMKGSPPKRRSVLTVWEWVPEVLAQWIGEARPLMPSAGESAALWPSERGPRIGSGTLHKRFCEYRDALGLDEGLDVHSLRRSYVTHLIEAGWDPLFVQQQAGHEHASTTSIYTCVSSDFRTRTLRRALDATAAAAMRPGRSA